MVPVTISECTLYHLIDKAVLYSLYVDYDIIAYLVSPDRQDCPQQSTVYVDYDIRVYLVSPDRQGYPLQSVC